MTKALTVLIIWLCCGVSDQLNSLDPDDQSPDCPHHLTVLWCFRSIELSRSWWPKPWLSSSSDCVVMFQINWTLDPDDQSPDCPHCVTVLWCFRSIELSRSWWTKPTVIVIWLCCGVSDQLNTLDPDDKSPDCPHHLTVLWCFRSIEISRSWWPKPWLSSSSDCVVVFLINWTL